MFRINRQIKIIQLLWISCLTVFVLPVQAKPPNILFILADDMRPDCISALGNPRIQTPNLDSLVASGMTFSRATCSYPICVVSRAEILTGMHGWENGISGNSGAKMKSDISFWAETLKQGGYTTWHVGKWHVSGRPSQRGYEDVAGLFSGGGSKYWKEGQTDWKGFPITGYRGWIFQSDDGKQKYPELGVGVTPDISEKFADAAISLIKSTPDKPWFCHVNFTAPHDPLFIPPGLEESYQSDSMQLPENYLAVHPFDHGNFDGRDEALLPWPRSKDAVKDLLRVYYSVIEDMDNQIGRIILHLDQTDQLRDTLIIFTSDHGMACGSHGLRGKQNMYEHTINVPLILSGPGVAPGTTSSAQVYLRELYPTTCEISGIPAPDSVSASSFAASIADPSLEHHNDIFGYFKDTQRMIRTDDGWKLIRYPQIDHWQLFDLNEDPFETKSLFRSGDPNHLRQFEHLQKKLNGWRIKMNDPLITE